MTSPSETPLDLDAIRAGIDMLTKEACYTPLLDEWALEMKRNLYRLVGDVERLRELEARPRTVGDLTARDLGRRMRIEGREFVLGTIEIESPSDVWIGVWPYGAQYRCPLDTPVEFLDDEPANGHQQPGERLPSHETSDSAQVDPDTFARATASAFRMAGYEVVVDPNMAAGDLPAFGDFGQAEDAGVQQ